MFEKYLLVRHDFQNVRQNGQITGFQVKVKIPYYRGVYISQLETPKLKIDDEEFGGDQITMSFTTEGPNVPNSPYKTYTLEEMRTATSHRWWFGDPAIMTVKKPGGLKPGVYQVAFGIVARNSYRPKTDPEGIYSNPNQGPGGATAGLAGQAGQGVVPGQPLDRVQGPGSQGWLVTQKMTLVR